MVSSKAKSGYYLDIYRFCLLLTGNETDAIEVFESVIHKATRRFSQLRCATRASRWLFTNVRKEVNARRLPAGVPTQHLLEEFAHLPELYRSAYALFCLNLFTSEELADLFHLRLTDLGEILQQARLLLKHTDPSLGQSSLHTSPEALANERLLACCLPGASAQKNKKLQAALDYQSRHSDIQECFEQQMRFDTEIMEQCHQLPIPLDLEKRFEELWQHASHWHTSWQHILRQPAFLAGVLSILFLVGWGVFIYHDRQKGFTGDEEVSQLIKFIVPATPPLLVPPQPQDPAVADTADDCAQAKPLEFAELKDVLFLERGLEHFTIPAAFAHYPISSYKVLEYHSEPVVFVVPKEPTDLCFLIFPSTPLGVHIKPNDKWKYLQTDHWNIAVHESKDHVGFAAIVYGNFDQLSARLSEAGVR